MDQVRCCGCGISLAIGTISCGECGALQGAPGPVRLAITLDHQDRTVDAIKALLLAYAFSTQKDQMVDYFIAKSQSTEFTSQTRSLFARALEALTTQGKDLDRFRG